MEKLTILEQQIIKAEILDYLRTEKRIQTAVIESNQSVLSYLHNKNISIIEELTRHLPITRDWFLEQINHNSELDVLKTGQPITFKQ